MNESIMTLYIYEQNLLKSCVSKLIESSSEIMHDNVLSIFDNIDEINRRLYNFLLKGKAITIEKTTKKKKETLYDDLDTLLLRIDA